MTARILFTGGGTAGHVTPNIALIERFLDEGWQVAYVGSTTGIERQLIEPLNVTYQAVASGKLRRYFSWQNFIDPLLILLGFFQALGICLRSRPEVVFSKGGFVAVPVVMAAWCLRIPVISHESDLTPGLANKLAAPFSRYICVTFPQTSKHFPANRVRYTGSPVRRTVLEGEAGRGRAFLGFSEQKPILLVVGGSLGARVLNQVTRAALVELLAAYQVIHIVGHGQLDPGLAKPGYVQKEYLQDEFGDVLMAADFVLSRAGANSVYELLFTRKRHILVPLTLAASRGDQLANAANFEAAGTSLVIQEAEFSVSSLLAGLAELASNPGYQQNLNSFELPEALHEISRLINQVTGRGKPDYEK